jgi:hypothetical protein
VIVLLIPNWGSSVLLTCLQNEIGVIWMNVLNQFAIKGNSFQLMMLRLNSPGILDATQSKRASCILTSSRIDL